MKKTQYIGFSFKPEEWEYHFYVIIPTGRKASDIISVYERYHWDSDGTQEIRCEQDSLKVQMPRSKWRLMADTVKNEFNSRLKQSRIPVGKFSSGGVPLEKLFGKELMVLLWAVEENAPSGISTALRNWLELLPEERWWLYTITNAASGGMKDVGHGWRAALRYALCENPVDDRQYQQLELTQEGRG